MKLRDHDLVMREIDDETVLLDLVTSTYLTANRTGTFLLTLLATDHDEESLAAALADEFDLSSERARADTEAFLHVLRERDLIR